MDSMIFAPVEPGKQVLEVSRIGLPVVLDYEGANVQLVDDHVFEFRRFPRAVRPVEDPRVSYD